MSFPQINLRSTARDGTDYGGMVSADGAVRILSAQTPTPAVPVVTVPTGSFTAGTRSLVMAAGIAANAEIYQFNYTPPNLLIAVVRSITLSADCDDTAFAAGSCLFQVIVARSWTIAGTGGAVATVDGNNTKMRTSFTTGSYAAIRTATTLALGAGTKTLDTTGIASFAGGVPAVAGQAIVPSMRVFNGKSYPLILAPNEGFVITQTVPITGTWKFSVSVKWDELVTY